MAFKGKGFSEGKKSHQVNCSVSKLGINCECFHSRLLMRSCGMGCLPRSRFVFELGSTCCTLFNPHVE